MDPFVAARLNRREAMGLVAGVAAGSLLSQRTSAAFQSLAEAPPKSGMGLVSNCARLRRDYLKKHSGVDLFEPVRFLDYCRELGAGGMQLSLGTPGSEVVTALRRRAEEENFYIEAMIKLPQKVTDLDRFDTEMKLAAMAGARAVRTVMMAGRRYEAFTSLDQFYVLESLGRKSLELAAPIAEKYQLPLAVENHKDQRSDERVALLERIDSEYVGACVDTGNSIALLEDPIDTVRALAPWAHSVHLKDQAVRLDKDGFLLADVPLGQGCIDLPKVVELLRQHRPQVRFSLELITRDPLSVPVLKDRYWTTFPTLPGQDLARILRMVRQQHASHLICVSDMHDEAQRSLEQRNVEQSLLYAVETLGI